MSMPFYVSPEQLMKDRADFARKGIARGRSVVVRAVRRRHRCSSPRTPRRRCTRSARSTTGSPSPRSAATTSSRTSASPASGSPTCAATPTTGATSPARGLANAYAQTLGTIFSCGGEKPYEVEIFVAEVGDAADGRPDLPAHLRRPGRRRARLRRDGRLRRGIAEVVLDGVRRRARPRRGRPARRPGARLRRRPRHAATRVIGVEALEVAVLDRTRSLPRKFRRVAGARLAALVSDGASSAPGEPAPASASTTSPAVREVELPDPLTEPLSDRRARR